MEGQIGAAPPRRPRPAHLVCGTPVWGVTGMLVCSYLAWLSYVHVRRGPYDWPHDGWAIASYGVWILLMAGLISETRCLRERVFFGLILVNFVMGFTLASWERAPMSTVRELRVLTALSWAAAAVLSAFMTFAPAAGNKQGTGQSS